MKPILIIDNSPDDRVGDRTDLTPWCDRGVVRYVSDATDDDVDPEQYGTVFVHMGNDDEVEQALKRFAPNPVFVFSGEWVERPDAVENGVYLPRQEFIDRLLIALQRYEDRGGVASADLFDAGQASTSAGMLDFVSFTGESETSNPNHLPLVRRGDGTVDYLSTLTPLAALTGDHRVVLEESYEHAGDGIEILRRLRMGAFLGGQFSRWPVEFQLSTPLDTLLRQNARAAVLLTPGVTISGGGSAAPAALTPRALLDVLESLPVAPGSRSARHTVANRWGAIRLNVGRRLLKGETVAAVEWGGGARDLLRDEEYWHLLARGVLRGDTTTGSVPAVLHIQNDWTDWEAFLSEHAAERPLRVLCIDDEGAAGWNEALGALFSGIEGAADLVFYPGEGTVDPQNLIELARESWDLVLCDLRLRPEDEELGAADPSQKGEYSGIQTIKSFKRVDGEAPTPVIAFTASDNSWTHAAALEAGAAGYWIKEGPEQGASEIYSRRNAAELLREIRRAIIFRDRRRFLWELIQDFRNERARLETLFASLHPGTAGGVSSRLDQIDALWLRAYGYLQSTPTTFEREAYRFAPEDIAFLHLFASLNQIRALRYKLGASDAAMVRSSGTVQGIAQGSAWATWTDTLRAQVSLDEGTKKAKPWKPKDSSRDAFYNGLLLVEAGRLDLDQVLNGGTQAGAAGGLRDLRNRLDTIHGDVASAGSQPHADLDDHIRPLCAILRCALLL